MAQTPNGLSLWEPADLYQLAALQPQFANEIDAAISTAGAAATAPRLLDLSATPADLAVTGTVAIASSTVATNVGMPAGWGMCNVYIARPAAGIVTNLAVSGNPPDQLAYRSGTISGSTVTWGDWVIVGNSGTREGALRLTAMRDRLGKVEVTTPATVTIVMDHGLTNVKSKVLPLLRARGLRATLAINSQKWDDPNNSGATQADVKTWLDVFEIANHGRTHLLTGSPGSDRKEIEQGRTELEAQLGVTIDTWVQTGNGSYPFGDGNAPEKYWSTETGRIITRTHAVYTGLVPHATKRYPIDGHPKLGAHGFWIDQTTTTAQAQVQSAISEGTGVIVRLHPQFLDQAGYLTTAQLTTFLDWLVARRTAGEVTVLPFREWSIATKKPVGGVTGVNGKTGAVTLTAADVGAETPAGAQAKANAAADAAETAAKDYAGTLAYGTDLEATDATVGAFVTDGGSDVNAALATVYGATAAAPSGGDDTTSLNALLAAHAGKVVQLRPGRTYTISDTLVVPSGTTLDGRGATIDAAGIPSATALGQQVAIRSEGTLAAPVAVADALTAGGRVVTGITSTTGLAPGDLVVVANDERPVPGLTRTSLKKAELNVITSVDSATQVTLAAGALYDYGAVSLTVRKVQPVERVTIRDLTILMGGVGSGHNGVSVTNGRDVTVERVTIRGAEDTGVRMRTVWGSRVTDCDISGSTSPTPLGTTGYGVSVIEGSTRVTVAGNVLYDCRHFVSGGGAWPAAHVDVVGNYGTRSSGIAFDCHEPTLHWTFRGNTAVGVAGGFIIRGQHITLDGNTITNTPGSAINCYTWEGVNEQVGLRVVNNRITRCGSGITIDGQSGTNASESIKRDVIVSGNTIRDASYVGMRVRHFDGATVTSNTVTGVPDGEGIQILGLSAATPSTGLTMSDCQVAGVTGAGYNGISVTDVTYAQLSACKVNGATAQAIMVTRCFDTAVNGCQAHQGNFSGLRIDQGARLVVHGGTFTDAVAATGDGVRVTNSSDVTVTGVVARNNRHGVYITGTDYVIATGINGRQNASSSVTVNADAVNKVVANNL